MNAAVKREYEYLIEQAHRRGEADREKALQYRYKKIFGEAYQLLESRS
jgi:hypothetical protein